MQWQTPEINLFKAGSFNKAGLGSDSALANILLLADKYDTEIAVRRQLRPSWTFTTD